MIVRCLLKRWLIKLKRIVRKKILHVWGKLKATTMQGHQQWVNLSLCHIEDGKYVNLPNQDMFFKMFDPQASKDKIKNMWAILNQLLTSLKLVHVAERSLTAWPPPTATGPSQPGRISRSSSSETLPLESSCLKRWCFQSSFLQIWFLTQTFFSSCAGRSHRAWATSSKDDC